MEIPVRRAKSQLGELVRKAEAGEQITLTHRGHHVARLVPSGPAATSSARRRLMEIVSAAAAGKELFDVTAARSQDFLFHDDDGIPV